MSEQPEGGVWYEPRSLWSVSSQVPRAGEYLTGVSFERNHYSNPGPYPIIINRIAIAAINYPYRVAPTGLSNFVPNDSGTEILNSATRFKWGSPQRQNYSRNGVVTASLRPKPTAEPSPRDGSGTLYGQCRLNFEKPLYLPRTGSITTALTSIQDFSYDPPGGGARINVLQNAGITSLNAHIVYLEAGGYFAGSSRAKRVQVMVSRAAGGAAAVPQQNEDGWPWPLPPNLQNPTAGNGVPFFPPQGNFSAAEFDRQEATRSGSTKVLGVSVAIDQIAYNAAWLAAPFSGIGITPGRVAPVSQSVGCAIRVTNGGGGGASWWRPGAPISLVLDTITPAVVYDLDEAVTLQPGDAFSMDVQIPGLLFGEVTPGGTPATVASNYVLGVSLNGYAAIKG